MQFAGQDARGEAIIKSQFNCISPENVLKWESVHPEPDKNNFEPADRYVEFGEKHGMTIIGHCLVWHNQTPAWVFNPTPTVSVSSVSSCTIQLLLLD